MEDHSSCLPVEKDRADLIYLLLITTARLFTTTKMRPTRAGDGINQSSITPNYKGFWHVNPTEVKSFDALNDKS